MVINEKLKFIKRLIKELERERERAYWRAFKSLNVIFLLEKIMNLVWVSNRTKHPANTKIKIEQSLRKASVFYLSITCSQSHVDGWVYYSQVFVTDWNKQSNSLLKLLNPPRLAPSPVGTTAKIIITSSKEIYWS